MSRLTNDALLDQIAQNDQDIKVRLTAAARRTEPPVLVVLDTVATLTDQETLAKIALYHLHPDARRAAVAKLTDSAVLKHIVQNDEDNSVRRAAEKRLKTLRGQ